MINVILWVVFGGVAGWIAGLLRPVHKSLLRTIAIGITGALIGGVLLTGPTINRIGINLTALVMALIGAVILLAVDGVLRYRSARS